MTPWRQFLLAITFPMAIIAPASAETLTLAGSSTVQGIVSAEGTTFKKTHAGADFIIGGGGSGHGISCVEKGLAMIGMVSRPLTKAELERGLVGTTIAMDGITVVVHPDNPVTKITKEQYRDILLGRITNWKQLGGQDLAIVPLTKENGHATTEMLLEYLGLEAKVSGSGEPLAYHRIKGTKDYSTVAVRVVASNRKQMMEAMAVPGVLAYGSTGWAENIIKNDQTIKIISLDGVRGVSERVADGTYPLCRPLLLVTKGQPQGLAQEFIRFILGTDGQAMVEHYEFLPVASAKSATH